MYRIITRRLGRTGAYLGSVLGEGRTLGRSETLGQRKRLAEDRALQQSLRKLGRVRRQTGDLRVPTYLLVGFLGSGKTTLLARLIEWCLAQGLTPGLVINEFGQISIDGQIVQRAGLSMTELANGCICCTAEGDLVPALIAMSLDPRIDIILVEATGLADPADMLDTLTDPALWRTVEVGGIISVVDSSRFLDLVDEWELTRHQVQYADALVLSKGDLIGPDEQQALLEKLDELAPGRRQFEAANGQPAVGVEELLTYSLAVGRARHTRRQEILRRARFRTALTLSPNHDDHDHTDHEHGEAHHSFHTLSLDLPDEVDRDRFEAFLGGLPPTVYRAKGFVRLREEPGLFVFQQTPNQVKITPFATPDAATPASRAVFIGQSLDETVLRQNLAVLQD